MGSVMATPGVHFLRRCEGIEMNDVIFRKMVCKGASKPNAVILHISCRSGKGRDEPALNVEQGLTSPCCDCYETFFKHDMKLRHIALRGLTRYQEAEQLQNEIVKAFLAAKADPSLISKAYSTNENPSHNH
jgi:hypothetical protein